MAHRAHRIAIVLHRLLPPEIANTGDYVAKIGTIGHVDSFGGAFEVGMVGLDAQNWVIELTHSGLGCGNRTRHDAVRMAAVRNEIVRATRLDGRRQRPLQPQDINGICDIIR